MQKTFKLSQAAGGGRANETTIRTWITRDGLKTDVEAKPGEHRRFSLADVARIRLVSHLVNDKGLTGSAAIEIANKAFDAIASFAAAWISEAEAKQEFSNAPGPWLAFTRRDVPLRVCNTAGELLDAFVTRPEFLPIVIDLNALVHAVAVALHTTHYEAGEG